MAYTFFLVHPESGNPAFIAISYWWNQHKVERVGGPPTFYLPRILQYEFAIVLPALVWIGIRWRPLLARPSGSSRRSGLSSVAHVRVPRREDPVAHRPPDPAVRAARRRGVGGALHVARADGLAVAGPRRRLATVVTALSLSFWNPVLSPSYPRAESVVYVQTTPELMPVVAEIVKFGATRGGPRGGRRRARRAGR